MSVCVCQCVCGGGGGVAVWCHSSGVWESCGLWEAAVPGPVAFGADAPAPFARRYRGD